MANVYIFHTDVFLSDGTMYEYIATEKDTEEVFSQRSNAGQTTMSLPDGIYEVAVGQSSPVEVTVEGQDLEVVIQ